MSEISYVCWPPLIQALKDTVTHDCPLSCVVSPFIQLDALRQVFDLIPVVSDFRILTRWNASDLISGVSDPEIFPFLESKGVPLYITRSLHSKIYTQTNGCAFIGSGNLTGKGLGLNESDLQFETAAHVKLSDYDNLMLGVLFDAGERVTHGHYERAKLLIGSEVEKSAVLIDDELYSECELYDLPLVKSPDLLWKLYKNGQLCLDGESSEGLKFLVHLQMPERINSEVEFHSLLKKRFLGQATVGKLLSYIREFTPVGKGAFNPRYEGVQNGALREWLSSRTSSDHLDIAKRTNNLECWLPYCKPEIEVEVDIPGRGNSRVFYWRDKKVLIHHD